MGSSDALEERLADEFCRDYCVLVGRATTGLKLLIDELVEGTVLYPSYICPVAVYPCYYSGVEYEFCDVEISDYNLSADTISEVIDDDVDAVVGAEMFGHPFEVDPVEDICEEHDAVLIEDACNAVGSTWNGDPTGSFGVASVVSFGKGKPIEAGCGGAVLTDDEDLAAAVSRGSEKLKVLRRPELERLNEHYVEIYTAVQSYRDIREDAKMLLYSFPRVFKDYLIHGFASEYETPLQRELEELSDLIERRRIHADIFREELSLDCVRHPDPAGDPVFFRYGVLVNDKETRDEAVERLRADDVQVNTLHEPMHSLFETGDDLENTEYVSDRIINLKDDPRASESDVRTYARRIREAIEQAG